MQQLWRLSAGVVLAMVVATGVAHAEAGYFVIERAGSTAAPYVVTDEVLQRVGGNDVQHHAARHG